MIIVWVAAAAVFLIVEAATVGLTSIWFAFGSLAGLLAAALGGQLWLQIVCFIVVTAVTLAFTRPLAKKYVDMRKLPTNADRLFGMRGVVVDEIDNIKNLGTVSVGGQVWTARSKDGSNLPAGVEVTPVSIEGVKLIVVRAEKKS